MKYTLIYSHNDVLKVMIANEQDITKLIDEFIVEEDLDTDHKDFSQILSELLVVFEGELTPKQITVERHTNIDIK